MYPRVNLAMHDSGLLYKRFLHTSPMSIADSIASTRTVQQRTTNSRKHLLMRTNKLTVVLISMCGNCCEQRQCQKCICTYDFCSQKIIRVAWLWSHYFLCGISVSSQWSAHFTYGIQFYTLTISLIPFIHSYEINVNCVRINVMPIW